MHGLLSRYVAVNKNDMWMRKTHFMLSCRGIHWLERRPGQYFYLERSNPYLETHMCQVLNSFFFFFNSPYSPHRPLRLFNSIDFHLSVSLPTKGWGLLGRLPAERVHLVLADESRHIDGQRPIIPSSSRGSLKLLLQLFVRFTENWKENLGSYKKAWKFSWLRKF